MARNIIFI